MCAHVGDTRSPEHPIRALLGGLRKNEKHGALNLLWPLCDMVLLQFIAKTMKFMDLLSKINDSFEKHDRELSECKGS